MITVSPMNACALPFSVAFARSSEDGYIVVASKEGKVSLFDPTLFSLGSFTVGHALEDVSLAPYGRLVAVCGKRTLSIIDSDHFERQLSFPIGKNAACRFSADGKLLWLLCDAADDEHIDVQICNADDGSVVREKQFRKPAGGTSHFSLYWAERTARSIGFAPPSDVNDRAPPAFSSDGNELLLFAAGRLSRWDAAPLRLRKTISVSAWSGTSGCVAWVGDDRAIVSSEQHRLYLVDLEKEDVIDEIAIEGATELESFITVAASQILSVHRGVTRKPETSQLVMWNTTPLLNRASKLKSRVMYIESKSGGLIGPARIGRVEFSKTGKTLYYRGKEFRSLKGRGFKANYYDVATGDQYWISGCKKDGSDRLYGERLPIKIDADVRDEYWSRIRGRKAR